MRLKIQVCQKGMLLLKQRVIPERENRKGETNPTVMWQFCVKAKQY